MPAKSMTVTLKDKNQLLIPPSVQRRARIKVGDRLQFNVSGGVITIIPELPTADDEYTPKQRRIIDTRLAKAQKGPYYGPFETANEAVKFLRSEIKARKGGKRKTSKP